MKKESIASVGILLFYGLFFIPFLIPIALAAIFACGLSPLLVRAKKKILPGHYKSMTVIAIVVVIAALIVLGLGIAGSISDLAEILKQERVEKYVNDIINLQERIPDWLKAHLNLPIEFSFDKIWDSIEQAAVAIAKFALSASQKLFLATPQLLLKTLIFILSFILLLPRVESAPQKIDSLFPMGASLVKNFISASEHVLFSTFLIGGVQSLIISIGALFCGYSSFLLVFFVAFIFSLIPVIGAGTFGVFLALLLLVEGTKGAALGMLAVSLIAGTMDNIIRSMVNASYSKNNVIVSFIALVGSIMMLGISGIFIAPVAESLVLHIIRSQKTTQKPSFNFIETYRPHDL